MSKHTIYQIAKSNKALASQSIFYGISDAFSISTARKAFADGYYNKAADVEANNLSEASTLVNTDRANSKILISGALRNVSIGDIILDNDTGVYSIVSPVGFDRIKITIR